MATLSVTAASRAGIDIAAAGANMSAAQVGGDKFTNTGSQFAIFHNTGALVATVTLAAAKTVDGQSAATPRTVTVGAGASVLVGPFLPSVYNDANGYMNFTYSETTTSSTSTSTTTTSGGVNNNPVPGLKVGIFSLAANT